MNNRRGSVLVATLGFILVFVMLGWGAIYLGTLQNEAAEKQIASTKAFWLAEAGLQKTLWEINKNNCHELVQEANQQMHCISCDDCGNGNKVLKETVADYGDYDVVVEKTNIITTTTSTGSFPSRTPGHPLFTQRKVRFGKSVFSYALFAKNRIVLKNGIEIDSYDSVNGSSSHDGDIGTNSAGTPSDPSIQIEGAGLVHIFGDVSTGGNGVGYVDYGGPVQSLNVSAGSNPYHISCHGNPSPCENIDTHNNDVPLPSVVVPPSLKTMTPSGQKITDNTTLSTGNYRYDSINLVNNKTLTIDGKVNLYLTGAEALDDKNNYNIVLTNGSSIVLYVDGRVILSNNITISSPGRPADFQIFSTYQGNDSNNPGIFIKNNSAFYGTIYAPETNIELKNNQGVYGAVVGEDILIKNSGNIFYDESLGSGFKSSGTWQEI